MKKVSKIVITFVLALCVFLSAFSVGVSALETVQVKLPGSDSLVEFELEDGATVEELKQKVAAYLAEKTGKTFDAIDLTVLANQKNALNDSKLSDLAGMALEVREALPEEKFPDYLEEVSKGAISTNFIYTIIEMVMKLFRFFYGFFTKA